MKIGDEVYVHGYVDEIRKDTVIIKNKGGYFGTCKKEIDTEFPFSQLVYPTDKFSVVVHDDKIRLINKNDPGIKVTVEMESQPDCAWR